ncbi:hypothetical protein D9M68_410730 [compost metagenome]
MEKIGGPVLPERLLVMTGRDLPLLPATFIAISRFIVATLIVLALMDLLRSTSITHI